MGVTITTLQPRPEAWTHDACVAYAKRIGGSPLMSILRHPKVFEMAVQGVLRGDACHEIAASLSLAFPQIRRGLSLNMVSRFKLRILRPLAPDFPWRRRGAVAGRGPAYYARRRELAQRLRFFDVNAVVNLATALVGTGVGRVFPAGSALSPELPAAAHVNALSQAFGDLRRLAQVSVTASQCVAAVMGRPRGRPSA